MSENAKKFLDLAGLGIVVGKIMDSTVHSVNGRKGVVTLAKGDVGLGNVTNDAQVKRSEMGAAGGVATLDSGGKVPAAQLPSYVDDVLEYDNMSAFPASGESGKIYVDKATNKTYRWSGSAYTEISASIALGETSSTAFAGDKGKQLREDLTNLDEREASHAEALAEFILAIKEDLTAVDEVVTNVNQWRKSITNYVGQGQQKTRTFVAGFATPTATNEDVTVGYGAISMGNGSVSDGEITLPAATDTTAGVMTAGHVAMLVNHDTKISALESKEPESISEGEINALFV